MKTVAVIEIAFDESKMIDQESVDREFEGSFLKAMQSQGEQ